MSTDARYRISCGKMFIKKKYSSIFKHPYRYCYRHNIKILNTPFGQHQIGLPAPTCFSPMRAGRFRLTEAAGAGTLGSNRIRVAAGNAPT
jgi:hypothetical protein